jgi:hypothetical protein
MSEAARKRPVFFYGLFMDPEVLRGHGVESGEGRRARVDGQALRIGERATLVPKDGAHAYGMAYGLEAAQLQALYSADGLESYAPTLVTVHFEDGLSAPAECWVLAQAPEADAHNPEYVRKLREALTKLRFPADYVASVG